MARTRRRRTDRGPARSGGGLSGGGFPLPMGKAGGGGIGLIILLVVYLLVGGLPGGGGGLGVDPGTGALPQAPEPTEAELKKAPADDPAKFVDFVAGDVDATWKKIFAESGKTYEQPSHRPLRQRRSAPACGNAPSTVGPFYCPNDRKVYLDIAFMNELQQRLGAQGDFAQAYIVAHEIGHHVQNLLGVMEDVNLAQQENPDERERPLGPARAAGRLPRRDLGALGRPAGGPARDGRPRGGAERGRRRRRRPDPEAVRRQRQPGHVHPRQRRAAGEVVQGRLPVRRPDRLRHLQGRRLRAGRLSGRPALRPPGSVAAADDRTVVVRVREEVVPADVAGDPREVLRGLRHRRAVVEAAPDAGVLDRCPRPRRGSRTSSVRRRRCS